MELGKSVFLAAVSSIVSASCQSQVAPPDGGDKTVGSSDPAKAVAPSSSSEKACCVGKNECKGKGGCKTASNACAGKNECKGKGGCSMRDCK